MCPAQAADRIAFYSSGRSIPGAIYDWSGLYIGLTGGYTTAGSGDSDGGAFGGQIGYRWQNSNWVFGIEAQASWIVVSGGRPHTSLSAVSSGSSLHGTNTLEMVTGQAGYSTNNVLLYLKAGAAVVNRKTDWNDDVAYDAPLNGLSRLSPNATNWGGVFGAGLEYGFAPNWSVGVEYDRVFSNRNHSCQDINIGLLRLNYRFD